MNVDECGVATGGRTPAGSDGDVTTTVGPLSVQPPSAKSAVVSGFKLIDLSSRVLTVNRCVHNGIKSGLT